MRALLLLLLLPATAAAEQFIDFRPNKAPGTVGLMLGGEYRIQGTVLSEGPKLDRDGTRIGQPFVLDQRIRLGVGLKVRSLEVDTEWDLLSGQLAGSLWDLPVGIDDRHRGTYAAITPDGFVPRRLAVKLNRAAFTFEGGLISTHWGLGLLANDGAHEPVFGRVDDADRAVRLRTTFRPLVTAKNAGPNANKLNVSLAVDWGIEDDFGSFADRQLILQGIGSVIWNDPDAVTAGAYVVYRHQRELLVDRVTNAAVLDGYVRANVPAGEQGHRLEVAIEAAGIAGTTDRTLTYGARDGMIALSGGLLMDGRFALPEDRFTVRLRTGLSSGDPNPDDRYTTTFAMDRNVNAGAVMFDQVRSGIELATWALLNDPENLGHPPDGIDGLVREGAIAGAGFVQPILQGKPLSWLEVRGGVALAWQNGPVLHPFYSARAGGSERTQHDTKPFDGNIGMELNWAVDVSIPLPIGAPDPLKVEAVVQGAHARLGGAVAEVVGDDIHQLLMTARFRF
jgi:hypothetical protein